MPGSSAPPRVFISYAWESDDYRSWVESLAVRLLNKGVNVRLDRWHARSGSIPDFMDSEIRQAGTLLLLCSPMYRQKVHAKQEGAAMSGVGWEAGLITGAVFAGVAKRVVIALASGTWQESAPDFLLGNIYRDISTPAIFESGLLALLRDLFDVRPDLPAPGDRPEGLDILLPRPLEVVDGRWAGGTPTMLPVVDDGPAVGISIRQDGPGEWKVSLEVNGNLAASGPFQFDPDPLTQPAADLAAIEANTCKAEDIRNLGCELWTKLLQAPALSAAWDEAASSLRLDSPATLKLRLEIPTNFENLPWEALYDYDAMALATSPRISLVRATQEPAITDSRIRLGRPLRLLVVVPSASGLSTTAEWERIQECARNARGKIELKVLDGYVTLERLAEFLQEDWDIVHFIGHGRLVEKQAQLRFNKNAGDPGEDWVSDVLFAQQFRRRVPRLIVLNCCNAGSSRAEAFGNIGSALVRAKVAAVLVMRYEIRDSVAAEFAAVFYRELLAGARAGRVDLATQEGRAAIERTFRDPGRVRSYITPVLYLAAGGEQLFVVPAIPKEEPPPATAGVSPPLAMREIPVKLLHAISKNSCLPIIGPGIFSAAMNRQEGSAPAGPAALAQELARISRFPAADRLTPLADNSGEWLISLLLERICQHFESEAPGERGDLNELIESLYSTQAPTSIIQALANWQAPAMIYTFVDGLLEAELRLHRARDLKVVQIEDILAKKASALNEELVLLQLRGTWRGAKAGDSRMFLTEADSDRVLEGMPTIAAYVADLMNKVGSCTVLFVGVSPRDQLVRALARQILLQSMAQNRGTAFFVTKGLAKADALYWDQFPKLEILEIDEESLIQSLTSHARSKRDPS